MGQSGRAPRALLTGRQRKMRDSDLISVLSLVVWLVGVEQAWENYMWQWRPLQWLRQRNQPDVALQESGRSRAVLEVDGIRL